MVIAIVFSNQHQSLPVSIGQSESADAASSQAEIPSIVEIADTVTDQPEVLGSGEIITLPVISTDNAPVSPPGLRSIEQASVAETAGTVQIPNPNKTITVLLAGAPGCSTCGIEAQQLSRLLDEYGSENLSVVFVDIYNFGGPEMLAWFANVLEATNLTWAIDVDGSFKERYAVDLDSTVIMNPSGEILYRDDSLTSHETLRDQIALALSPR
jgi:thiol-disulfide isomerase/thioredoxin